MLETLVTLTMYIESNCTKYDFPSYTHDKCYVLSSEAREGIKDYWDDYGINIEFVDIAQRRHNIYRPRVDMKKHENYMKEIYNESVADNNLELGDNDYIVRMGAGLENTLGFASFKHNIFQVDDRQATDLNQLITTFNHELGHAAFQWKHTDESDNLMVSHSDQMTDDGLNPNQKQDIASLLRRNKARRACSVNPRFGCPCGRC